MDIMWINWLASGLTLLGNIVLIKYKTWKTFIIFFIGNSLYVYYWTVKKEWPTLILVLIFICMNIWGLIKWKKDSKNASKTS